MYTYMAGLRFKTQMFYQSAVLMPLNFSGIPISWGCNTVGLACTGFRSLSFYPLIVGYFCCLNPLNFNRANTNAWTWQTFEKQTSMRNVKSFSGLSGVFLSESEEAERGTSSWPLAHTLKRVTDVMLYKVDLHSLKVTLHWVFALMSKTEEGHPTSFLQFVCSMINIRV